MSEQPWCETLWAKNLLNSRRPRQGRVAGAQNDGINAQDDGTGPLLFGRFSFDSRYRAPRRYRPVPAPSPAVGGRHLPSAGQGTFQIKQAQLFRPDQVPHGSAAHEDGSPLPPAPRRLPPAGR